MRTADCTEEISILTGANPDYPTHTLHVYRLNVDVDARNALMLNALAPESAQYSIQACDAIAGQTRHVDLSNLCDKIQHP